jgi:hypothetical protein
MLSMKVSMIGRRHSIHFALVALSLLVALVSTSCGSSKATANQRCFAVNVVGRTVQQAREQLRARGCSPGSIQDGRHFLVTKSCRPMADFGRVFAQSARNRQLGPRERLILRAGMRRTADGRICGEFNPNPGPAPSVADYNGSYSATFTVTQSSTSMAKVGQQMTGIAFTARNGKLAGDINGNVNAAGQSANATSNLVGLGCNGRLTFTLNGNAVTVAGRATCVSGGVTVTGNIAGRRTGS